MDSPEPQNSNEINQDDNFWDENTEVQKKGPTEKPKVYKDGRNQSLANPLDLKLVQADVIIPKRNKSNED